MQLFAVVAMITFALQECTRKAIKVAHLSAVVIATVSIPSAVDSVEALKSLCDIVHLGHFQI